MKKLISGILSVWLWMGWVSAQAQLEGDTAFWQSQILTISTDAEQLDTLQQLADKIEGHRFFFMGEQHWKSINRDLQFSFLTYLYEHAGVRNVILETSYSYGYLINHFLDNGDTTQLRQVVENWAACPVDQYNLWKMVYAFNQTKPKDDQIRVTGIDLEYAPGMTIQVLKMLNPKGISPESYLTQFDGLAMAQGHLLYSKRELRRLFIKLDKQIEKDPEPFKAHWGDQYPLFKMILQNTLDGYNFTLVRAFLFPKVWEEREIRMYRNFLQMTPSMQVGGCFAQFGALHTDLSRSMSWKFPSIAKRLNESEDSPYEGQVLTFSRFIRKFGNQYKQLGEYEALLQMVKYIDLELDQPMVMVDMRTENTPFPVMSQNFQFLIVIDPMLEGRPCD
ncbi:hypothetical protein [Pontibacter sp. G13]|uniref:hypothetical protein n=1 Tax=Pontibacter sp. G13 TaxID=3074898 RepID=UPI00288BDFA0|nr:hypothetical protein [Pontibacter sp. G13]WNJ21485.1 hypothetical protein RJD25_13530 [Pontibacter sp. G13]